MQISNVPVLSTYCSSCRIKSVTESVMTSFGEWKWNFGHTHLCKLRLQKRFGGLWGKKKNIRKQRMLLFKNKTEN